MGLYDFALVQEYHYGMRQDMERHTPEALMMSWISETGEGWKEVQKTSWLQFIGIRSTE